MKMRSRASAVVLASLAVLTLFAWAQTSPPKGVLKPTELKQLIPTNYFFADRTAPVQGRNSGGVRFENGKLMLAALVDTSGYSTEIRQKYQGLFITETPIDIEGSTLKPGAYGFGFNSGKFLVMDIAADDLLSVSSHRDDNVKPAVPLKVVEQEGKYRLYAGKDFVSISAK
jgi:hypothetical protein